MKNSGVSDEVLTQLHFLGEFLGEILGELRVKMDGTFTKKVA